MLHNIITRLGRFGFRRFGGGGGLGGGAFRFRGCFGVSMGFRLRFAGGGACSGAGFGRRMGESGSRGGALFDPGSRGGALFDLGI